ncbi:TetR/AcrR family transcriptional regulator [Parafrankia soli]|uniref:TetR/AcrR family transcriptional regulator n=1 Tax=Parafrankia soli TaxID=2599596 RepID=UPI000A799B0E|nr:TetR/AcrR family transcriptional regulator [Parafrankia soli]
MTSSPPVVTDGLRSPAHDDGAAPAEETAVPAEPGSARWWTERALVDRRRRPRAGGLSTERIVETALEILREEGLEALTVRSVAERLGTSNASLYRHIASRDELIALIADHVMGDIRLDRTGRGWRADVEALMLEMRRVILSQPLPPSAGRSKSGSGSGPNMLRLVEFALALYREAGLTDRQAVYTTITMIEFVGGSTNIRRSPAGRGSNGVAGAADLRQLLDGLPADDFPALRTAGNLYTAASADDVFTHGMTLFLDGVASQLPSNQ